ncbi:MAG: SIR2 family protein [Desulfobacteraceae bacterium]|nr:SIR2 family protein [Desulfobacteraceae bacterium]
MISDQLDSHYKFVIKAMIDNRVVPFLGAGANRCGRAKGSMWQRGEQLPDGGELSEYLADVFEYPEENKKDLVRVAQYVSTMAGSGPLYDKLHELLDTDYPFTSLTDFLTGFKSILSEKGYPSRLQLIVTTNYDDLIERAFQRANQPFDLVTYQAEGEYKGKFLHLPYEGDERLIEKPNEYDGLSLKNKTVILKIHGTVDRINSNDSYVITEDDYIEYLSRMDISNILPVTLSAKMKKSHFLFLGYSLRDWNLRVFLNRIWREQRLKYNSWAIQLKPNDIDQRFWAKRNVEILSLCLEDYIAELSERLRQLKKAGSES